MSCTVRTKTRITDSALLSEACDRLRDAGVDVQGPRPLNARMRRVIPATHRGWVDFDCGEGSSGEARYDSDFRIDADELLSRLQLEYGAAACAREMDRIGGSVVSYDLAADESYVDLLLDIPEEAILAAG